MSAHRHGPRNWKTFSCWIIGKAGSGAAEVVQFLGSMNCYQKIVTQRSFNTCIFYKNSGMKFCCWPYCVAIISPRWYCER